MFTTVYSCLFTNVYPCLLEFTYVYTCLPMFTPVYSCLPMFTYIYHCLLVFVYLCLFVFTYVYPCLLVFTYVYYSIRVNLSLPQFTRTCNIGVYPICRDAMDFSRWRPTLKYSNAYIFALASYSLITGLADFFTERCYWYLKDLKRLPSSRSKMGRKSQFGRFSSVSFFLSSFFFKMS